MDSPLNCAQAIAQLQNRTVATNSWRRLNRFTSSAPLVGMLRDNSGTVRIRDLYPSFACARQLQFFMETVGSGTKLRGVLRLRTSLFMYEVFCVAGMLVLQLSMIYLLISGGGPLTPRGLSQILQQFMLLPFCWLYVRTVLWLSRKKETRMLNIVREALQQVPITPSSQNPAPRQISPPTPTEIFFHPRRPRHIP